MSVTMTERAVDNGGVRIHVTEAVPEGGADPARPPVVLVHGWPETSRSWRYQLPVLAEAGWRALAVDLRGFGRTSVPAGLEPYRVDHVATDLFAVLDDLGADQGIFVGHDWGSIVLWDAARLHPERFAGLVGMSVPLSEWPMPPVELFRTVSGDRFMYIVNFQDEGVAEPGLEKDVRTTLRNTYWTISGAGILASGSEGNGLISSYPAAGTQFLETMRAAPAGPLPFLPQADEDAVVADFEHSGFRGGLSYYRSFDANWQLVHEIPADVLTMPTAFIGGALDPVVSLSQASIDAHPTVLPDYRGTTLIPDIGHWVQQEAPGQTNAALLAFLAGV